MNTTLAIIGHAKSNVKIGIYNLTDLFFGAKISD